MKYRWGGSFDKHNGMHMGKGYSKVHGNYICVIHMLSWRKPTKVIIVGILAPNALEDNSKCKDEMS